MSIEDTVKAFEDVFAGNGRFAMATDALAETFEGTVSMLGDKLFTFKNQVNETFFEELKKSFGSKAKEILSETREIDELNKEYKEFTDDK